MNIRNMVHQGTVLGLPLWNVYYAEVAQAVNLIWFMEMMFAYDLNCFKDCGINVVNETLHAYLHQCQFELHKGGNAIQVSFDLANESKHILFF